MSESSDSDDLDAIREQKKQELKEQLTDESGSDEPIHVDSPDHFQQLLKDNGLVLVDFYADWCGPCKMLEPTVEAIAAETTATVAKIDIDAHQNLAREYSVQGVPTLYLFAEGEPVERMVGVQDKNTLETLVAQHA